MKKKIVAMFLALTLSLLGNTAVWAGDLDESQQEPPAEEITKSDDEISDEDALEEEEITDTNNVSEPALLAENNNEIAINEENFPDAAFREIVKGCDEDGNGSLSQSERDSVEVIGGVLINADLSWSSSIEDATGIEYFTNLKELNCYSSEQLRVLDVSKNINLEKLTCSGAQLTSLDVSNNPKLKSLSLSRIPLGKLDLSNNPNLESLGCALCQLTSLDISKNVNLRWLHCGTNQLTSLDVSNNIKLETLAFPRNQLTNIDLGNNPNLEIFNCRENQLTNLDISKNQKLDALDCSSNQLSDLDVSKNPNLRRLWCDNNQLRELNVDQNIELVSLKCYNNHLPEFELNNNKNMLIRDGGGDDIMHTDWVGAYTTPQSISKTVSLTNGKWSFDLASIVGRDKISRVNLVTEGTKLSDNGIVTFSGDEMPTELEYTFDTKNPAEDTPMTVHIALGSIKDQTGEGVSVDISGLDLDRICEKYQVDPSKAEIVLSQETPKQADAEKLTQKANTNGYSPVNTYEILMSLYSDGNKIADITEDFGNVILTLQAGKDYAGRNAAVYQLHNGEEIIVHDGLTVDADGMVTITVDKFSAFTVAVQNNSSGNNPEQTPGNNQTSTNTPDNQTPTFTPTKTNTPNAGSVKTGDSLDVVLWSMLFVMSVGVCAFLARKKYCKNS